MFFPPPLLGIFLFLLFIFVNLVIVVIYRHVLRFLDLLLFVLMLNFILLVVKVFVSAMGWDAP